MPTAVASVEYTAPTATAFEAQAGDKILALSPELPAAAADTSPQPAAALTATARVLSSQVPAGNTSACTMSGGSSSA